MSKKLWAIFSLDEAVCGISNSGFDYDEYGFTIGGGINGVFDSEEKCEEHIKKTLKEYENRGVGKGSRFIILPVFCHEDDKIFLI